MSENLDISKVPPNAVDFEEAVLGALMIDSSAMKEVATILRPESFYTIANQRVFEAAINLYESEKPIDILTVTNWLKINGHLETVGGVYAVSELTDRVASSANVEFHARIIQEKFIQRELIRISAETYQRSFAVGADVLDLIENASLGVVKVASMLNSTSTITTSEQINEVINRAELAASNQGITGLQTGHTEIDKLGGGRQKGHLIVVAGRPAMGKTAYALCQARNMAVNGSSVLFVSLEMGAVEMMQRILSMESEVYLTRFRNGEITESQWRFISDAANTIRETKLRIVDDLHTLTAIRTEARKMKESVGLDAIFIDYIQLVSNSVSGRSRENEVSEISRSLKLMARSLDVPVIALSQLSRAVETRAGKRPMLSDLRESGSIEQDADIVEFLFRPEYYGIESTEDGESTHGMAEVIVAKNRFGACATIPLRFRHELTKFTDWNEQSPQPQPSSMRPNENFYEVDRDDVF